MRFPKQFVNSGALANAHLTAGDLRLLIVLITMAGEDHVAPATQTALADNAGLSRKSIRASIDRLTKQHLLQHKSNRGRLTEYTVLPEYRMAPPRAIRVPTYSQANGTSGGANFDAQMAPPEVPTSRGNQPANPSHGREIEESFSRAWGSWPKKVERNRSLDAFDRASKIRGLAELEADVTKFGLAYAVSVSEARFVPSLRSWLDDQRWTDDLPVPPVSNGIPTPRPRWQFNSPDARRDPDAWMQTGHLTRTEQNMAVVRRMEARERAESECVHRWMPDDTCNHCTARRESSDSPAEVTS